MAAPSQLLAQHIESFVDSSRSSTHQAASLDEIVSLLRNDKVTLESLVRELGMYLTTTDDILRARGILLLGEVLAHLSSKPLDNATVHKLMVFFTERLADWRAFRGALVGCLALARRKKNGVVSSSDAKALTKSYLQNLQVQSLGQHDRKLCFELLECLLQHYPEAVACLGEDLVYGICEAIDQEMDPQCLMLTFHIVEILVQLFPDPHGPISNFASDLFTILGCYFPIHFTHAKPEDVDIKRDELSRALMLAFSSASLFEPFVIPLLLEKLSSSLPLAKVDSLKFLSYCSVKYGAERMAKHAGIIWSSLKDTLHTSVEEPPLSLTSESLDGLHSKENEIVKEALTLLEKVIIQNTDLFLKLIVADEEINMIFNTVSSYKSYSEVPSQTKQKLQVVGHILHVSAKASVASCNQLFESFFPRLMETLGYSIENGVISRRSPYGTLFLCTELLGACRDFCTSLEDLTHSYNSTNETWCSMLHHFSSYLGMLFSYNFSSSSNEPANEVDLYLGVKGLQILTTFPRGYSLIPKLIFDNILLTLISVVTADFDKAFSWKLALKALVHIGSFIHMHDDSEKAISYVNIIVDKVIVLVSSGDSVMPFSLKLEALSNIGSSGIDYMRKIALALEEVISVNLCELYVQGNLKSNKVLLQLLECYSDKVLPWIQQNGGFEEVVLRLVVNLWSQIEDCKNFAVGLHEKELLDATMKVMKFSVACCSVESQNIIADKAYHVVSTSMSFSLKECLSTFPVQLESLDVAEKMDKCISRDEWILSLFASTVIALHPQAHVPNIRTVLSVFMSTSLKGHVAAAQALGSLLNKLGLKSIGREVSGNCTLEEAMDIVFDSSLWSSYVNSPSERFGNGNGMDLTSVFCSNGKSELPRTHAIVGLAWIGKGLLMRGHERVKDITMVFLECLLSSGRGGLPFEKSSLCGNGEHDTHLSVMRCAADAFQILMSDSELCLNRKFHAMVRPLYKQRFFSTVTPILQSLIIKSDSIVTRCMLYRAFAHVISDTPITAILSDAKKLITMLLDALSLLSKEVLDKDTIYSLLLVLAGILTDKNGQEAAVENAHGIINGLVVLVGYPHMMLVRETAIQCLGTMSNLPHTRIYPMRIQVLKATSKALDDPKRAVRQEAVKCRHAWASIASRGLHL